MNSGNPNKERIVKLPGGAYGVVLEGCEASNYSHTVQIAHLQVYFDTDDTSDVSTQTVHTANLSPVTDVESVSESVPGDVAPNLETLETLC